MCDVFIDIIIYTFSQNVYIAISHDNKTSDKL